MPLELVVSKQGDYLAPASEADRELLSGLKQGQGFRVELIQVSARSLQYHKLYWGGLVRMVADYWEPENGLISSYDKKVMGGLIDWIASNGKRTEAITELITLYLEDRKHLIKSHLPEAEEAAHKLSDVHEWLKVESGYYDPVLTPTGVTKRSRSINFNAMNAEEFKEYYRRAFGVAWRYVFSKNSFKTEAEAMECAEKMAMMG